MSGASRSPTRGGIANRYLQNLNQNHDFKTSRAPSTIFSTSPLKENTNIFNQSRRPSISPVKKAKAALTRSETEDGTNDGGEDTVTGLKNRKKLAKKFSDENLNGSWFDNQRQSLQGYEYLCRVGEAKRWIESCINEKLPSESELCNDGFRDGVILAKLTRAFVPQLVKKIVPSSRRLQFKHTENINNFFKFLDIIQIPELFRFELTDLYDKKNIPKVIFCIHALSYLLAQDERAPQMTDLVGKLEFTDEEINASQKALDGASLPNFSSVRSKGSKEPAKRPAHSAEYEAEQKPSSEMGSGDRPSRKQEATYCDQSEPEGEHEPSNEELEDVLRSVIKFQSFARGSIFRYKMFVSRMILKASEQSIVELQSVVRRKQLQNGSFMKERVLELSIPATIMLQAQIRGAMTRKLLRHSVKKILRRNQASIVPLQSVIRGAMLRGRLLCHLDEATGEEAQASVARLQAVIRRIMYERRFRSHIGYAFKAEKSLIGLQAIIRGYQVRKDLAVCLNSLYFCSLGISVLQAVIRRKLFLQSHENKLARLQKEARSIVELQAKIKSSLRRQRLQKLMFLLVRAKDSIVEVQSIARAGIARNQLNVILDTLEFTEAKVTRLSAVIRGNLLRARVASLKEEAQNSPDIVTIQSLVRGLLSRFQQDMLLDDLESNEPCIVVVQAAVRGMMLRKANRARDQYYLANIDKVIKVQSYIKGKDFGDAYKKLLTMANPPIHAIAKFAHLLNDTDKDFQDEVYLNQLNEKIIYKTKQTEELEQTNKDLDIKIALLVRNKITLDELIKQRNNGYTGYKVDTHAAHGTDINSLTKPARQTVETYQKIFYLLQTDPGLFVALEGCADKLLQACILKVFNYGGCGTRAPTKGARREEYMFMRLLSRMVEAAVAESENIDGFAALYIENGSAMWQRLFVSFLRTPKQKNVLKSLFGPLISSISDISDLSLESSPLKIYHTILEAEGKPAQQILQNVTVEEAIQHPKVRNQFVNNLAQLRELGNSFLELLWKKIDELPIFLTALMSSLYASLKNKFHSLPDNVALSVSGYILVDLYMNSIVKSPENYGIMLTTVNSKTTLRLKDNLLEITKLLSQMALMTPFPLEEVYLQPLNDYIQSQTVLVEKILKKLTKCPDIDRLYDMSILHDLSSYRKPTLTMDVDDLSKTVKLLNDNKDLLKGLMLCDFLDELAELNKTSRKSLKNILGTNLFQLTLNPIVSLDNRSKKNALLIQAKRCVIYMLQVQQGKNLMDLLLSKIKPSDEDRFAQIIHDEIKEKTEKNMYTNAAQGSLGDLTAMSYHDLKCLALEKILELESMGILDRHNNFQQLINEIAHDIKAKKDQRQSKEEQIKSAEMLLLQVQDNETRLRKKLDVYNDYISKAMASLQSQPAKKSKKKLFPFLNKQYFYQRELRRQGKTPKFGSYKYSAKYLSDQGILAELKGIQCSAILTPPELPKVDFMFTSDEVGVFLIEAASGSVPIPDAVSKLTLDDLLSLQYENKDYVEIYDGIVKFYTDTFLNFIFKKFYDNSDS